MRNGEEKSILCNQKRVFLRKQMENDFFKIWFEGFDRAIREMNPEERSAFFRPCAKACSDSYPAKIFVEAYADSTDRDDFLKKISERMEGVAIEKNDDGSLAFEFPECYCELYRQGYVTAPELCECSRLSLIDNFEAAMGPGCVEVELIRSILGGADTCRLLVRFLQG